MSEPEAVSYRHGAQALTGWLFRPGLPARAAIVLFPTIANRNAAMDRRAIMLAKAGYLVMIADFYGKIPGEGEWRDLAERLRADPHAYRQRIAAAIETLRARPETASLPMFAIGYCMGGQAALEAARDGQDLLAVASFHGLLTTDLPARPGAIRARMLVCHGDADPLVPREQVLAFWQEMDDAGADWHFHAYAGVRHGFTDPASDTRGMDAVRYDRSADRQSWSAMAAFFDETLERHAASGA